MINDNIKSYFRKFRKGAEYLDYGRDIIVEMAVRGMGDCGARSISVLDIGVGSGRDLMNVKERFRKTEVMLYGVDSYIPNVKRAQEMGIETHYLDIERQQLPFLNNFFDIVIANQIIEHTKEIFFIFSEISRVIKHDGALIVGVPNLTSLHNRVMLLLGEQPPCIEVLGPHVRAYTKKALKKFIEADNYFEVLEVKGSNFYPFPVKISPYISRIFPTLSISLFFLCRRTNKKGTFINVLNTRFFETAYYRGEPE